MTPDEQNLEIGMRNAESRPFLGAASSHSAFRISGVGVFDRWTLLACFFAGGFMVWGANAYTVFDDEALSCRLYAMPMGEMIRALWRGEDPDPPFYYLFQNLWVRVFGVGPFALRGMSILMFLAGLVAIRGAAQAWFDRRAGIAAMVITAMHPAYLFFGFAGRWYSMMFLLVAVLMRLSAPRTGHAGSSGGRTFLWGLVAAAACYSNYFGPVIVGLIWVAMVIRDRADSTSIRRHIVCAILAAVLYAPWVPVFWHHAVNFPQVGGGLNAYASSAARLGMTLFAGNLAGPAAWWVWGPMTAGLLCGLVIVVRDRRQLGMIAFVVFGAIVAGVLSRTLIDKYALIVSGPFCVLIGAALAKGLRPRDNHEASRNVRHLSLIAAGGLAMGWAGCMYNLAVERHWSSLRWLDPFDSVTRELYEQNWHRSYPDAVCSHPSARYYFALHRATDSHRNAIEKQIQPIGMLAPPKDARDWTAAMRADPTEWLDCYNEQDDGQSGDAYFAKTPTAMLRRFDVGDRPSLIITLETAGFVELPEWEALRAMLTTHYREADEPSYYLEDESAALKDRLDPAFRHPRWRITVRRWRLKP